MSVVFDCKSENSELNQYWYSPQTILTLVRTVELYASRCAFLSTPSLYFALKNERLKSSSSLFEFDRQWEGDSGFVFYDYQHPQRVPVSLWGAFDFVVVDPPFITRDVWASYIETVRLILAPGGKVLFTTVVENWAMLEELLDEPLTVPRFRPSIPRLTYQYHCFANFEPTSLSFRNDEIPDDGNDAARSMTNAMRESEREFARQMRERDRANEKGIQSTGGWSRPPPGVSEHPEGGVEVGSLPPEAFGERYIALMQRRETLGRFKDAVDALHRCLNEILKGSTEALQKEREEALHRMREAIALLTDEPPSLQAILRDCVDAHTTVTIEKQSLKELAADTTRKFKSPIFNRQRDLLALMKAEKVARLTRPAAAAAVEPQSEVASA